MTDAPEPFELQVPFVNATFGSGRSATLRAHLERLGVARPLLVGTPAARFRYDRVFAPLADAPAATFFDAAPHCPEAVVERCRNAYLENDCDGAVAIGGGSTLGLGKILAAENDAKLVALPTTYSGSEMTPLYGRKIGNEKRVARDVRARPLFVIYDPELTRELPRAVAVASGMNSVAHAVEALYTARPNPLVAPLAEEALRAHRDGLRAIARGAPSARALAAAQYGGFLGGLLVAMCGIALHHWLCHVIGGLFDLPHRETNSAVLPHAVAYNAPAIGPACAVLERVFDGDDAARALYDFARELGAPQSLRELGMPESGIAATVAALLAEPGWNPRPLERDGLETLVRNAYEGVRP